MKKVTNRQTSYENINFFDFPFLPKFLRKSCEKIRKKNKNSQ